MDHRRSLGLALLERADDVADAVLDIVWPGGAHLVDAGAVQAVAETDRVGARQIGQWLIDGREITEDKRRALGSLGGLVGLLTLDDLVKAHLAWRDVMLGVARDAATRLRTPTAISAEIASVISRNTDGSVVRMARRFEQERQLLHARIAEQALHDGLTGMPNRRLLFDRLEQALRMSARTGQRLAVLFIDLDGFKTVNDQFGHQTGDRVLVMAAQRIRGAVPDADTVARLGGDEFVVLCDEIERSEHAVEAAQRIIVALGHPFRLGTRSALISASVGIAEAGDCDGVSELLMRADMAMYDAKRRGPGDHRFAGANAAKPPGLTQSAPS